MRVRPIVEINVVDPVLRKGYRFKGPATIYQDGLIFEQALAFYRACGVSSPIERIVLIKHKFYFYTSQRVE